MKQNPSLPPLPPSSASMTANLLSGILFFGTVWYAMSVHYTLSTGEMFALLLASMLPMLVRDAFTQATQGALRKRHPFHAGRIIGKLIGLYGAFAFLMGLYWLLPEYHDPFYSHILRTARDALPWLMLLAIPYTLWLDPRMEQPEDGQYHLGLLLSGGWRRADRQQAWGCLRAWLVKGFFLPLMATYFVQNIQNLPVIDGAFPDFMSGFNVLYNYLFTLDLVFACAGYMMTFRALNTHIASAEPTFFGWAVCLACYAPFWALLFSPAYFTYEDNYTWETMVQGYPVFQMVWGGLILFCVTIYAYATLAFGYRFSNLTYRGLISNGPYRFTKHPAYVFKCASWWLMSLPFISSEGWDMALKHSLLLAGVCGIYYLRARTEENHLSQFPEYVAYAEAMNHRSIFRWIPFLRYTRAKGRA